MPSAKGFPHLAEDTSLLATALTLDDLAQVLCILYDGGKHAEQEKRLLGTVSFQSRASTVLPGTVSFGADQVLPLHALTRIVMH